MLKKRIADPPLAFLPMSAFSSHLLFLLLSTILASSGHVSGQDHARSVFILAGQSNMAGRGGVTNETWDGYVPPQCRPNPYIFRLSPGLRWERAREPLHGGIDINNNCGVGPGLAFAADLVGGRPGSGLGIVGLVPCAEGATKITEWARGTWLYNRMVQRARKAVENGGTIRALLWYQGESDTIDLGDVRAYGARITQLFHDIRNDLNRPNLPIIQVAIATSLGPYINEVRRAQLALRLPNVVTVDAKGSQVGTDYVHLTTSGEVQLGYKLADAFRTHFHI